MKYIYVLALLVSVSTLHAFEVEDNKKFSAKVAPTQMSASLSFFVSKSTQAATKSVLDNVLREAKNSGGTACKGGEYYVYPTNEYDQINKKNTRKGYDGSIRFECRFTDIAIYDNFLELVNKQIKSKDSERINIYPIVWDLSDEEREAVGERLKITALEYMPRRAAEISRATRSACELKKISFDNADVGRYFPVMKAQLSKTETPIPETKEVSVNAHMLFECKR